MFGRQIIFLYGWGQTGHFFAMCGAGIPCLGYIPSQQKRRSLLWDEQTILFWSLLQGLSWVFTGERVLTHSHFFLDAVATERLDPLINFFAQISGGKR